MTPPKSPPQPAVSVEQCDIDLRNILLGLPETNRKRRENGEPIVEALLLLARHRLSAAPPADGVLWTGLESIIANIRHRERNAEALWHEEGAPTIDKCDKVPGASAFWLKAAFHRLANDLEALSAAPKAPTAPIGEARDDVARVVWEWALGRGTECSFDEAPSGRRAQTYRATDAILRVIAALGEQGEG